MGSIVWNKHAVICIGATLSLIVLSRAFLSSSPPSSTTGAPKSFNSHARKVPFVLVETHVSKKVPPWKALFYSLESFHTEISNAIRGLSRALEQALELEEELATDIPFSARLSTRLERRIESMSRYLEDNENTLKALLQPIEFTTSIAAQPWSFPSTKPTRFFPDSIESREPDAKGKTPLYHYPRLGHHTKEDSTTSSILNETAYTSAGQIVVHIVRDWTILGAPVRASIYDWCVAQLQHYHRPNLQGPVLVPGAGAGRLAYDISAAGYNVEANELSCTMASSAHGILQKGGTGILYPFLLDAMSNEVDASRRYDSVAFPDIEPFANGTEHTHGTLSFTIGDFVGPYYSSSIMVGHYSAIVTSFFVDTATNLYEYVELFQSLLPSNGLWINIGPLQWHKNAQLFCTVDELRELLAGMGFQILHWSVDNEPTPYRHQEVDNTFVRSTNFDGYRPLRFVVMRI